MEVILRADVAELGKTGDVVDVSEGYARNFLVPQGLAMRASSGAVAQAAAMRKSRDVRVAKERAEAEQVASTLVPKVIAISAKAGEGGKLFGSVTTTDIAVAVLEQTGIELDRRQLELDEPIKSVGMHTVQARLHAEVQFPVTLDVSAG